VQDGDPRAMGKAAGYTIRDEINERPYLRGTVGMALDWKDTGGSSVLHHAFAAAAPRWPLHVFGQVVHGMDVVDRLVQWDVIRRVASTDGVSREPLVQKKGARSRPHHAKAQLSLLRRLLL
jgi:cyclophilin family peptidyl-prolyl cis-trans isomerase